MTLVLSFDPSTGLLDPIQGKDRLVALLYHEKFSKHASSRKDIAAVINEIKRSSLGDRIKSTIPTAERIDTTVKNVNWVLKYWGDPATVPNPINETFGYKLVQGKPQYADT